MRRLDYSADREPIVFTKTAYERTHAADELSEDAKRKPIRRLLPPPRPATSDRDWLERRLYGHAAPRIARCRKCGCTEGDCSGCIARTGSACHWVEPDLCSACPADTRAPCKRRLTKSAHFEALNWRNAALFTGILSREPGGLTVKVIAKRAARNDATVYAWLHQHGKAHGVRCLGGHPRLWTLG